MPRINIQGTAVEYLDQGSGDLAVLLHSSGASAAQWRALTETLAQHYRVIAPDLYGYGATPHWAGRGAFSLCHEAAIVHELLDRLGAPAHLIGHSYGGAVALHVAGASEQELLSLTLIEPVPSAARRGFCRQRRAARDHGRGRWRHTRSDLRRLCRRLRPFRRLLDRLRRVGGPVVVAVRCARPAARQGGAGFPRDAHRADAARRCARCRRADPADPWRRDEGTTRRICNHLARTLPEARLHTIDGAGHMAPLTHGDAVNPLVVAHLATNATHLIRRTRWASCR